MDKFRRNELGGIKISEEELKECFSFIERGSHGRVTKKNLKVRVHPFAKNLRGSDF